MRHTMKALVLVFGFGMLVSLSGCAPEVGSDKWCAALKEKPKGDWSSNEAADFAKNCILK